MTTQSKVPGLLSTVEFSDYLAVPARTLEAWRARAGGPPFIQFGAQVWYSDDALIDWMNERKVTRTKQ